MQGLYNDDLALQNATAAQARAYVEWYLSRDRAHAQSKSPVVVARVNTICVLGKGDQSCEPGRISRARFLVSIKTGQTPWSKVMSRTTTSTLNVNMTSCRIIYGTAWYVTPWTILSRIIEFIPGRKSVLLH